MGTRGGTPAWARTLAVIALAIAGGVFVGCGSGDGGGSDDGAEDRAAQAPDSVTIAVSTGMESINPARILRAAEYYVTYLYGATLTQLSADGAEVVPGLAAAYTWGDDGLSLDLELREGLTFSDGAPLTAKDVVATFEHYLSDKANVNAGLLSSVERVANDGDRAVTIELSDPYPSLPTVLASPTFTIFPAAGLERGNSFFKAPISAGPYTVESWTPESVVLNRNDSYYGDLPVVRTLIFNAVVDSNTRIVQLKSGAVDIADGLPASAISQVTGNTRAEVIPQFGGIYIYVNNRRAPLDDGRVRKAIALAVDREAINDAVYEGRSKVMDSFWADTFACCHGEGSFPPKPDIEAAKELLQGTSCAGGCSLRLWARNGTEFSERAAVVVQQNLEAIGIEAKVERVDPATPSVEGGYELEINSLSDVANYPDTMLNYGLLSDGGIEALFSGYKSADMDKAVREVIASDGETRDAALAEIDRLFESDVPYVPLVNLAWIIGTSVPDEIISYGTRGLYEVATDPR